MHLDYIKFKTEKRFENKINELIDLKNNDSTGWEKLSQLRLHAKETQSLFDIIQSSNPPSIELQKLDERLRELNHILEKCNNLNQGLTFLSDFIKNYANDSSNINMLYSDFNEHLKKQREKLVDEFNLKWETFLELAKNERDWISIL